MDCNLDLLLKYPLMKIKQTEENDTIIIEGKMLVKNTDVALRLRERKLIDGERHYTLQTITKLPKAVISTIKESLSNTKCQTTVEALDKIIDILRTSISTNTLENHCDIYRKVIQEYSEFTKFFLNLHTCKLSEDLTSISSSVLDSKMRNHSVTIRINYTQKCSDIFHMTDFDLPQKEGETIHTNDNLISLFDQFVARIELLQPYFNLMEDFDTNASILDPDKPRRRDAYRRIWLEENISVIITVDPFNVFQRPDFRFLGPEKLIDKYYGNLNANLASWGFQEDIFQAVLDLLGLQEFPKRETTKTYTNLLVEYGECSICFSLRLEDKLPDIICQNKCCAQFYHTRCLYNWLMCLNVPKRTFNNISGNCPNCEKIISCSILD